MYSTPHQGNAIVSQNIVFPFNFHGDKLYIVEHKGEPYVAMKHIVEGMGLSWGAQHIRLKERFSGGISQIEIPLDGRPQDMVCMSLRKLPGWLMSINPKKVKAEIQSVHIELAEIKGSLNQLKAQSERFVTKDEVERLRGDLIKEVGSVNNRITWSIFIPLLIAVLGWLAKQFFFV